MSALQAADPWYLEHGIRSVKEFGVKLIAAEGSPTVQGMHCHAAEEQGQESELIEDGKMMGQIPNLKVF